MQRVSTKRTRMRRDRDFIVSGLLSELVMELDRREYTTSFVRKGLSNIKKCKRGASNKDKKR
jgi:hypothetical protein